MYFLIYFNITNYYHIIHNISIVYLSHVDYVYTTLLAVSGIWDDHSWRILLNAGCISALKRYVVISQILSCATFISFNCSFDVVRIVLSINLPSTLSFWTSHSVFVSASCNMLFWLLRKSNTKVHILYN